MKNSPVNGLECCTLGFGTVQVRCAGTINNLYYIHLNHYRFFDGQEAYSEFSKAAPMTSFSCRLYNNNVKATGNHVICV